MTSFVGSIGIKWISLALSLQSGVPVQSYMMEIKYILIAFTIILLVVLYYD